MQQLFITGGSGNLGTQVCNSLEKENYMLHLAVRHIKDEIADNCKKYYELDLNNNNSVNNSLSNIESSYGNIAAGIFMAGGYMSGNYKSTEATDFEKMIHLNFFTAYHAAKYLLQHFENSDGGKLIFVGAKAATDGQVAFENLPYALSKLMLINFSDIINAGFSSKNISAYTLLPGTLDTEQNRRAMPDADFSKWTKTEHIADAIKSILNGSDENKIIHL